MIADGSYRLIGIKKGDITAEFDNLINNAKEIFIVGGYSFTQPHNRKSILKKLIDSKAKIKHCVFPIDLFRGPDANRNHAITLINNGVSVSLEADNHSKWLLTENEVYFGSVNFTKYSIEKRIEVVAFKTFIKGDLLRSEFVDFTVASMRNMRLTSNRDRLSPVINRNTALVSANRHRIKKLNPSIRKVISTLDSLSQLQSIINQILVNNFWLLDDKYYLQLSRRVIEFQTMLGRINSSGNRILREVQEKKDFSEYSLRAYNDICDRFNNSFTRFDMTANDYIQTVKEPQAFTLKNRDLVTKNYKAMKKMTTE